MHAPVESSGRQEGAREHANLSLFVGAFRRSDFARSLGLLRFHIRVSRPPAALDSFFSSNSSKQAPKRRNERLVKRVHGEASSSFRRHRRRRSRPGPVRSRSRWMLPAVNGNASNSSWLFSYGMAIYVARVLWLDQDISASLNELIHISIKSEKIGNFTRSKLLLAQIVSLQFDFLGTTAGHDR